MPISNETFPRARGEALGAPAYKENWLHHGRMQLCAVVNRLRRRSLFQKVVIANTVLIAIGVTTGIYLEKRYFAGQRLDFLLLFTANGVSLSILINYLLVKIAFSPLEDLTETMKAVRAGHQDVRVPETVEDPQIKELSQSFNLMLDAMEQQRLIGAAASIKAQEEERKRIARELHDETSQSLTGLVIRIKTAEECVPAGMTEVSERLGAIKEIAHATLNEVHTMAVRLRPSVLDDLGLLAALRSYIKEFQQNTGIHVELELRSFKGRLSPELETVLYRVVQEALTNVARHSGANACKVALHKQKDSVRGEVSDNGQGFDVGTVLSQKGRGLGLHGIKERIELVGGFLEFRSAVGMGSSIQLEVPVSAE